ncbi:MAG: NADH-quinone oxidoreductase subunit NuoF [Halanaerobium sp.]|nr:NADH-quinone oxidoreductase subunit NuoF [Halanaerobium sp.]
MALYRSHVLVCGGAGCISSGCQEVKGRLLDELSSSKLDQEIQVVVTGCMGLCDQGPLMIIYPEGTLYCQVKPEDVGRIVEEHLLKGRVVKDLLFKEDEIDSVAERFEQISFFNRQSFVALRNTGIIDPMNIKEYIARDGYQALGKALYEMSPEEVIKTIQDSGLRGRGGGGFPTGLKWKFAASSRNDEKYVVCNADEGDPGAFMDRSILEGDPHSIIEAMSIAGYAIGASQGYVYVRAEYPLAVERLQNAIEQAKENGLLGEDVLGTDFNFDLEIRVGAGAFVCGEETALLKSIEGKRGEPRPRPPYPANEGLWGKPTLLNNVETYANVPSIILNGAEWFRSMGTEGSPGTKVFALAGNVKNTGLVVVPMGISLGEIIYDIGGGIPEGKKLKAAQTGGPSGGCIPREYLNTPIDYDSLKELGTIMGSGGLIVLDEDTCMVDFARFFLEFITEESCGKCAPCRLGTSQMLKILERITHGEGQEGDIERLIELSHVIKENALCGLGQTAPNPVLTTIRYFRDEYEAHIRDKKCPASVCAALFTSRCQNACSAEVDVPRYIAAIRDGNFNEAVEVILEKNPLPAICGRVCNHPCEGKCQRSQLDEPLAIKNLKRFAADYYYRNSPQVIPVKADKEKVAVVGSGPSGLTAAYYLALQGYQVTIFEAEEVKGGLLRLAIPSYRLPRDILSQEIEMIENLGVDIRTGIRFGSDINWPELEEMGFQALYLATGAHKDRRLGIPGEELAGVYPSMDFLKMVNLGQEPEIGQVVAVIGGGNAAIDAARTALRKGAEEVNIIYRRNREDMPAHFAEIKAAQAEGVRFHYLTVPEEIIGEGQVSKMKLIKCRPGEFDSSGRKKPVPIPNSTFILDVDTVIVAIGQTPETEEIRSLNILDSRGRIDRKLLAEEEAIFAGGDCLTGPATVIEAIAAGRKAASEIARYLGGDGWKEVEVDRAISQQIIEEKRPRVAMPELPVRDRKNNFNEVELGYTRELAMAEAARCLRCDVKLEDEDSGEEG